jgi:hypothetical protein
MTAKEVRTSLASATFERSLEEAVAKGMSPKAALLFAGAKVAALCNHRTRVDESISNGELDGAKDEADLKALVAKHGLALATSRTNYIDPRIGVSFALKHGLPWTAALPGKALGTRYRWAVREVETRSEARYYI